MKSGEKPLPPLNKSPSSDPCSSSASAAALFDTKYTQFCGEESMGLPLPTSPLTVVGALSPATVSLKPTVERLDCKLSSLPSSPSSSSSLPKEEEEEEEIVPTVPCPLEALQGTPIPPFLSKTYDLVDYSMLDPIISWGPTGGSFVVWDPAEFSRAVLPRHFKHSNFSSFVRQINTYGFRKIGTDRWEFANEDFLRGKRTLLKNINRRRSSQVQIGTKTGPSVGMAKAGIESEVQKLRREKDLLTLEAVQLRQEHLMTVQKMDALNQRMQSSEARQKQMVSFLAKLLQNPVFLGHLKQLEEQREIGSIRVRRKFLKQQPFASSGASDESTDQQIVKYRSGFWGTPASSLPPVVGTAEGSSALLPVVEHSQGKQLPEHLLQGVVGKLGLDAGGQEFLGSSRESEELKGKDLLSSQIDTNFPGMDCFTSLPDDTTPDGMVSEDISPAGLAVSRPDSTIFTLKGKDIVNVDAAAAAAAAAGTESLKTLPEGIAQESMFPDAIAPATGCTSDEGGMWNIISLDAGEGSFSSDHAFWDTLGHYHAQEMEAEAGSCSLWDLGLHTFLGEDLDIDKYVGGETSLQDPKDDDGQNEDRTRDLEP